MKADSENYPAGFSGRCNTGVLQAVRALSCSNASV